MTRGQARLTGVLLLLAGLLPLAGVLDPDLWRTFSGTDEQALRAIADHPASTEVAGFLIGAGFVLAIPAVTGLAHLIDTPAARLAAPLFAVGTALTLADIAFGLKVSYDLATATAPLNVPLSVPLPSWYAPLNAWGSALFTAGTGLLAGTALLVLGIEIIRRDAPARWSGWVAVAAGALLLGQAAAFGGLLPAPQFLALLALGLATLTRSRTTTSPDQNHVEKRGDHESTLGTIYHQGRQRHPSL